MAAQILTAEQVRHLFIYDPETGEFISRVRSGNRPAGVIVGRPHSRGYVDISYKNKHFYAHRLAWVYMTGEWPKGQIDHINGVKNDNRFCNLRDVSQSTNQLNVYKPTANNLLGAIGIKKISRSEKYEASFRFEGVRILVGYFDSIDDARNEYKRTKEFMINSSHAQFLKRLVEQKDLSPNGLRGVIDLISGIEINRACY